MTSREVDALFYEKIVKRVYEEILRGEGYDNIEVKHNTAIKGLKGTHQIDVFWKFCYANTEHSVLIECKNYSRPINISIVRNFESVLNDIRNAKGIIVTKSGAQKGAISYAEKCGISIKKMDFDLISEHDIKYNIKLEFDYDITYNLKDKVIAKKIQKGELRTPDRHNVKFFDSNGNETRSIKEVVRDIILTGRVQRGDRFSVNLINDGSLSIRALDTESLKTVSVTPSSISLEIIVKNLGLDFKMSWGKHIKSMIYDVISGQKEYSAKIFLQREGMK